jgi:hypothetical protein
VLATAQTREARVGKLQWDETLRGHTPNPGWTTRLGDIGAVLGISAVAVGKILELLGYRLDKRVTESRRRGWMRSPPMGRLCPPLRLASGSRSFRHRIDSRSTWQTSSR